MECDAIMAAAIFPIEMIARLVSLPSCQMWTDYDAEADVLYISFRKPQQANDSVMQDDGSINHYRDGALVGITIRNASRQAR